MNNTNKVTESVNINRPKKRELQRNTSKHGLSKAILEDITNTVKNKVMRVTIRFYSVAVAWTLRKTLNYGDKKIQAVMKNIDECFNKINSGELDLKDMEKQLHEECGLIFKEEEE